MKLLRPVMLLVLAAAAFAAVVPGGGFVFDDHVLVERNADLRRADVWYRAFSRDYYATSARPGTSGYYRPIAVLLNAWDVQIAGWGARGAHVTNIALHVATCAALPWALAGLGVSAAAAWGTAFVFAVHPVHAESVAFVSGRADVLATLFVILALSLAASKRRIAWFGVGVASLAALLSKEIAVVLPLLLVVQWRSQRRGGVPRATLVAVVAAIFASALLRQHALGGLLPSTAATARAPGTTWLPFQALCFAIESMYAPVRLVSMEPHPSGLDVLRIVVGVVVAAAIWAGAFVFARAQRSALRRCALAGGLALLPVLNLLPQETPLSERFLYLASAFLLVPVGVLIAHAWAREGTARLWGSVAYGLALASLLWISSWRAKVWRTDLSLWQQAVGEEPQRAAFWDRLGLTYTERRQWEPAERAVRRALELDADSFNAWHNLGVLLGATGRPAEAADAYRRALQLHPRSVSALVNLGRMHAAMHETEAAYAAFSAALRIKPDHADAQRLAGMSALLLGRLEDAELHLKAAATLAPQDRSVQQALRKLERLRE